MSKLLIISICLLLSSFGLAFVVLPKYRDFRILEVQVLEKEAELSSMKEYLSQLELVSKELEKYEKEISKINYALSSDPNLPSLFEFMQKACSENGLVFKKIENFLTLSLKKGEKIKETEIEFEVSGTLRAFLNFLSTLEKSARLIEISTVSFTSPKEGDIFSFTVKIKVYSY